MICFFSCAGWMKNVFDFFLFVYWRTIFSEVFSIFRPCRTCNYMAISWSTSMWFCWSVCKCFSCVFIVDKCKLFAYKMLYAHNLINVSSYVVYVCERAYYFCCLKNFSVKMLIMKDTVHVLETINSPLITTKLFIEKYTGLCLIGNNS